LNWVRLPVQIDEFFDTSAIEDLKNDEGKSMMMVIGLAF
jgi:hypothetical protein